MAENDTGNTTARKTAARRAARPGRATARSEVSAVTTAPAKRATSKKTPARKTAQTAAMIAIGAAAAAGAVYALRRAGYLGKSSSSIASLNKDVKRLTAEAVKSLVDKSSDLADQAGKVATRVEKKGRKLLAR
ncbi:hypothetical protein [Coralloluteibacterium stylophorae]|uniref:Uncharacterized protein n=1 Tax=Coralloluteibacterium stylophorae TaxID=1776034 RepID=A0A8J7VS23_9GAMM|nr:hypothetical protein [Coralloluteibacterium stylophorae]MBS7458151.1 hypothetical protein [Coralloluteibacterium stylophorae]